MNEKKYKKRFDLQQNLISRQLYQIESLKSEIEKLEQKLKEKDELINSIKPLKDELTKNVDETKKYKEEYKNLIKDLRQMKEIMNLKVYKGRWWLIRFLIK